MPNDELVKWVTSDVDFYALLGLTSESCGESELRRAYRKTALKYHPDKVGKDFDPIKYELFQAANDVLSDPELKIKYDGHRNAKLQRQRANELFEGKRRQMKEDLEARERGGRMGMKREREDDAESQALRKLAEEGKKRRLKRQSMMGDGATTSSPAPSPMKQSPVLAQEPSDRRAEVGEMERRERELVEMIREAEAAKAEKAQRRAEKKARKSGKFVPVDSLIDSDVKAERADQTTTPIKRPDISTRLKADEKSSASPRFSFSPVSNTPKKNDFAATMARLKTAEKQRLEEQIRQQETELAN